MKKNYQNDFPIFTHFERRGRQLIYLDSASTAEMSRAALERLLEFEEKERANVHRGIYALSERATEAYEKARETVRAFLNARSAREIIFTRNATESINLIAYGLAKTLIQAGDHILISRAEHHSNFLPWTMLRDEKGAILDIIDIDERGIFSVEAIERAITPRTKVAAFAHTSHVLGTINPIREMARLFRERGIMFLVDAAQSAAHLPLDVREIGCDFLAFSGHKMGGPMGIGVLYGKEEVLRKMPPFLHGGGMIRSVTDEDADWNDLPWKFEAGTPNVAGAAGLAEAINYIKSVGWEEIRRIDEELTGETLKRLREIPGIKIFGPEKAAERGGLVSFIIEGVHPVRNSPPIGPSGAHSAGVISNGIHPHDLATILDRDGICIRAGHHCAIPLHERLGVPATARASFWVYNTVQDIDFLVSGIRKAVEILKPSNVNLLEAGSMKRESGKRLSLLPDS